MKDKLIVRKENFIKKFFNRILSFFGKRKSEAISNAEHNNLSEEIQTNKRKINIFAVDRIEDVTLDEINPERSFEKIDIQEKKEGIVRLYNEIKSGRIVDYNLQGYDLLILSQLLEKELMIRQGNKSQNGNIG